MTINLTASIVRILDAQGRTAGAGFLLTQDGLIATCAHVVGSAGAGPGETVRLVFHATGDEATAIVEPAGWREPEAEDVAILRLAGSLPAGIQSLPLKPAHQSRGHPFISFGFPRLGSQEESHVNGNIDGLLKQNRVLQVSSDQVAPGVSGAPVFDTHLQAVVGMISEFPSWRDKDRRDIAGDSYGRHPRTNFAIPTEVLQAIWPDLPVKPPPDLAAAERAYLRRVIDRYARPATIFVEIEADTYEQSERQPELDPNEIDLAAVAELMRNQATMPDLEEVKLRGQQLERIRLASLAQAAHRYSCLILLGDPGSGKTTALNHLAFQLATENLSSSTGGEEGYLPLPLRLSEFGPEDKSVEAFIRRSWRGGLAGNHWAAPELAANLESYLTNGRLYFLFDALNEMPVRGFKERAGLLRDFIEKWEARGNRFVVTCRVLDYEQELQGLQRVEVRPFSEAQIQIFLQKVLGRHWKRMWAALTGGSDKDHRLLEMAHNPYVLTMMASEFVRQRGKLSRNRAELMNGFTDTLLRWAKKKPHLMPIWLDEAIQRAALSTTAFEMQHRAGSGAVVETVLVTSAMPTSVQLDPNWPPVPAPPEQVLTLAAGAKIVEMPVDRSTVRFYHQLLQEYFSAGELLKRIGPPSISPKGREAFFRLPRGEDPGEGLTDLWRWPWLETEMPPAGERGSFDPLPPPPQTGWEETTILAAGLAPENDDQLVRLLVSVNPVLAGRCLHEARAKVDPSTRQAVIEALLAAIGDPEVALRVRIAAGEVLGHLGDPRLGEQVTIPAGEFVMGDDGISDDERPSHKLYLPEYQIARYPLTNTEFAGFVEAGGYREQRWWTEAGWQQKEDGGWTEPRNWQDGRFNKPNQPVVSISWYESVAFCRWYSVEIGQTVRLPTEAEWEKAARGNDGQAFPWGNEFDPTCLNMRLDEQQVNTTTPVGIYPAGTSPFGLYDCAGNVWEWCGTRWQKEYPYKIEDEWVEEYLNGTSDRVLRGGSWIFSGEDFARCACRYRSLARLRFNYWGCRVVVSPI